MTVTDTDTPRTYHGRIVRIDDVLPDTRVLAVELDNREQLQHHAGQYARLGFDRLPSRPFSIASLPGQDALEFHIRNTGKGDNARALEELQIGAAVTLEGPFGHNHWRPSDRPLLALAGGLGIAPLKAILEAHLGDKSHAPARLYWGVRNRGQLYLDRAFQTMTTQYPRFGYVPVLSDENEGGRYRTGLITTHLADDFPDLAEFDIYMAGPPTMIDSLMPGLLQRNADPARIFCDGWVETPAKSG